jgi:hypothetical protein
MSVLCWYGLDSDERCENAAVWRYTKKALAREPMIPADAAWCEEHREGLEEDTERID